MKIVLVINDKGSKYVGKQDDINIMNLHEAVEVAEGMTQRGPVMYTVGLGFMRFSDTSNYTFVDLGTTSPYYEEYIKATTGITAETNIILN